MLRINHMTLRQRRTNFALLCLAGKMHLGEIYENSLYIRNTQVH